MSQPGDTTAIRNALENGASALARFAADQAAVSRLSDLAGAIAARLTEGGRILICGNGGAQCDAQHFAQEFTGRFRKDRPPLAVLSLGQASHLTCVCNDFGFVEVFAREVKAFGRPGDILIILSTSGDSPNLVRAADAADEAGLALACLLGRSGGKLKGRGRWEFIAPGATSDRIQEVQMAALHALCEAVERILYPEQYRTP